MSLDTLLQRADIWRGGEYARRDGSGGAEPASVPSGHPALDAQLPGGGWPLGALTELLPEHEGIGTLGLLLPALARLAREGRWLAWITPPHLPYAPALADAGLDLSRLLLIRTRNEDSLWALEQTLRSGACGAALAWPHQPDTRALRRLQLAAEAGHALGVLIRPARDARHASPAALRLHVDAVPGGLRVHILKRRGGWTAGPVVIGGC